MHWECRFISFPSNDYRVLLDTCREADNGEEESIGVKVFEHALDGLAIDPKGHAGSAQIQTAADHIVRVQQVLVNGGDGPRDATWTTKGRDREGRMDGCYGRRVIANVGQDDGERRREGSREVEKWVMSALKRDDTKWM